LQECRHGLSLLADVGGCSCESIGFSDAGISDDYAVVAAAALAQLNRSFTKGRCQGAQ